MTSGSWCAGCRGSRPASCETRPPTIQIAGPLPPPLFSFPTHSCLSPSQASAALDPSQPAPKWPAAPPSRSQLWRSA